MTCTQKTYFFLRLLLVFFLFVSNLMFPQLDSINSLINKEKNTTKKINILLKNSDHFSGQDFALKLSHQAYQLALNINDDDLIAQSAFQISIEFTKLKVLDSVGFYQELAIQRFKKLNNDTSLFNVLIKKFRYLRVVQKSDEALGLYNELYSLAEKLDNPERIAEVYFNMGGLFFGIRNYDKAISFYNKSLKLYNQTNTLTKIENCYFQMGTCYAEKSYYDFAIEYFERGLSINKKTKDCNLNAKFYTGIGTVYFYLLNNEKALYFYKEALAIQQKCDPSNVIDYQGNIAVVLMDMEKYKEAKPYLLESYFSTNQPSKKADGAYNLAQVYEQLGDYNTAMDFMDIYVRLNDSLNSVLYSNNLSEVEAKYRNEKQEEQNVLLGERLKNKSLQIYFALAGLLLLSGLAFFIFRGLKQQSKANIALAEKNKIIEEKSLIVEDQHKDITDSIKYAQRIQQAILPPDKLWQSILPQSFVYYQPKDILSGDFYWIEETPEFIYLAAADCTGHGVPGALMSIVNYNLLNKAVLEQGLTKASEILSGVNKWLTLSLHQTFQESAVRDGMDVSLCVINKATKELNYAGAFNSIYILNGNSVQELLPDKQPVGAFIEDNIKDFTDKYYQLTENDVVYMFTDGYADQFGGEKGKKFKYKNFQQLLIDNHHKSFNNQKSIIADAMNMWRGNLEQIDDMLVIGFKVS